MIEQPQLFKPPVDTEWQHGLSFPCLNDCTYVCVDLETYDPDLEEKGPGGATGNGKIAGVALAASNGFSDYFPIGHETGNLSFDKVKRWLQDDVLNGNGTIVGANVLYDLEWLRSEGITFTGPFYDIQVAEPLLDENRFSYSLDALAKLHIGKEKKTNELKLAIEAFFGIGADVYKNLYRLPPRYAADYAITDAQWTLEIFMKQIPLLEQAGLWDLFLLESRQIPMLLDMRFRGVRVDTQKAQQLHTAAGTEIKKLQRELDDMAGMAVDVAKPASLAKVFDAAGVTYPLTPKSGKPSFKQQWLDECPAPVGKKVVAVRKLTKRRKVFLERYILDKQNDGKIHGQFHQLKGDGFGARPGRYSSSKPNLQNIPSPSRGDGVLLRKLFIPEDGQTWWKVDWSQIEYRILVHYAHLTGKRGADIAHGKYNNNPNTDFHQLIADMCNIPRADAKGINFGLSYGMQARTLSENLGITLDAAKALMNKYHKQAPFTKELMGHIGSLAASRGYVKTFLGRRQRFDFWEPNFYDKGGNSPPVFGRGPAIAKYGEGVKRAYTYKALNSVIQGSAADLMKLAMAECYESGVFDVLGVPYLIVHDEMDGSFDAGNKEHHEALAEVKHIMETCMELTVPVIADMETGPNWCDVSAYKGIATCVKKN